MKKKKPGFTLMEMIIALSLTVIILGIASSMFTMGNKVFSDSDVKTTLQIEGQAIQEKISYIGMQASGIEDTVLGKVIKSYNKSGEERYYKFELVGKNLSRIEYSKNDEGEFQSENIQLISENVLSFVPTYGDSFAEFNINLSLKKGFSDVNYPIKFTVAFRNKGN